MSQELEFGDEDSSGRGSVRGYAFYDLQQQAQPPFTVNLLKLKPSP